MKIISPQEFKNAFEQVVCHSKAYEKTLMGFWENGTEYTQVMLGRKKSRDNDQDKCVLGEVATKLGLKYYKEYWSMDCVFYEKEYPLVPGGTFAEYIAVAVEHENNVKSSCIEMNKLSIWNTPLKVLITYCDAEDRNRDRDKYLNKYAQILHKADIFDTFSTFHNHLVIFGPKYPENNSISWTCYNFNQGKFIKM